MSQTPNSPTPSSSRPLPRIPVEVHQEEDVEVMEDLEVDRGQSGKKSGKKRKVPQPEVVEEGQAEEHASRSKRKRISKRNVLLWEKFIETDDKNVVLCNINPSCKARIRRPDGSTSGMMSHMQTRHPLQYAEYVKQSTAAIKEKVF
jgi:hypothetical protein